MNSDRAVRCFAAVDVDDAVREGLALTQGRLRYAGADVKWVAAANIHLTLVFLGSVAPPDLPGVQEAVRRAARVADPFDFTCTGLGSFGPPGAPRVVWAGVEEPAGHLVRVHAALSEELGRLGFTLEARPFAAHLTLGRVRTARNAGRLAEQMAKFRDTRFGVVRAGELLLFASRLLPGGSVYTPLERAAFARAAPS